MKKTKGYLPTKACAACGGACCKKLPGSTAPKDWGAPDRKKMTRRLTAALGQKYAIDWWEEDADNPEMEFVRPSTTEQVGLIRDPSWGGECVFLTGSGCSLPFSKRPYECRMLEPCPPGCIQHAGEPKLGAAKLWVPYQDVILEAERIASSK